MHINHPLRNIPTPCPCPVPMPMPMPTAQRGVSLIESLVALLVLAVGIMGLAGVQTRLLVESRTANQRATAVALIDSLRNQMLLNRNAMTAGNYTLAWGGSSAVQDCFAAQCTGPQMAQSDLNRWLAEVATKLPGSNASVFVSPTDARQIGIAIAWAANEASANTSNYTAADAVIYNSPFAITLANSGIACPANSNCHIAYVQP